MLAAAFRLDQEVLGRTGELGSHGEPAGMVDAWTGFTSAPMLPSSPLHRSTPVQMLPQNQGEEAK